MQKTFSEVIREQIPKKPLVVAMAFIALFIGYGLWVRTHAGMLVIHSPAYGSQVFIDEHLAGTLKEAPDALRLSEQTGKHNVIVSKEGYWSWTKDVEIKKHETTEIHPFIIPQNVPLESVPQFLFSGGKNINPNYAKALSLFENLNMSEEAKSLADATKIEGVTYAAYAPGRTDVLLVAAKGGIYAIGIEESAHPNFQPVYKAQNALFAKAKDGTLYIKDRDSIFLVKGLGK